MRSSPRDAPVTSLLLLVNLATFAGTLIYGGGLWHSSTAVQLAWGANFGPATQDGQWWRLYTAMFMHFGVVHLALNMWALWDVGRLVERLYGRPRFITIYVVSGVAGNLFSLVVQGSDAVSGGASGAIFSLFGALLVFLWRERLQVDRYEFRWMFGAASVFTLLTLGAGRVIPGIDNAAHIGGLVAGALLGSMLARPWAKSSVGVQRSRWFAACLFTLALVVMVWLVPPPTYRFGAELRARDAVRQFVRDDQRISENWQSILEAGRKNNLSFEQVAGSIETHVTTGYLESFEAMRAAYPGAAAPSAKTLEELQNYAIFRATVASDLAEGLRTNDSEKIQQALTQAQQGPAKPLGKTSIPKR
jgi:rhomboid protease GluP